MRENQFDAAMVLAEDQTKLAEELKVHIIHLIPFQERVTVLEEQLGDAHANSRSQVRK